MTAEQIALVVADLRTGRALPVRIQEPEDLEIHTHALAVAGQGPIVDATAIYHSLVAKDEPVYLYEDHPCIAPPWDDASICYMNEHGNVVVMAFRARDFQSNRAKVIDAGLGTDASVAGPWKPAEPVDWNRVRWVANTFVWIGGRSAETGPIPTSGPVHMWQFAIYDDGQPADLRWVHLVEDHPVEQWDLAHLVLLGALNFCNCRNVELVEPHRPRAVARRIARTGCRVHTINVFPTGRSSRSESDGQSTGVPLTSVRGHFACYGPEYGRGLLFGRIVGRFWIPQHARGAAEFGEDRHDYVLESP